MGTSTSEIKAPYRLLKCSFSGVGAGLVTSDFELISTGAGQTVSQSAGNLVIAAGTAIGETVIVSREAVRGSFVFRDKVTLSQRIAGNNFFVELADIVGRDLPYTINSAISVSVTFPAAVPCPFNASNVGQSVNLVAVQGSGLGMSGRYAIASVVGRVVTFTVSGWPASGTGTLMLAGWNMYSYRYLGTTATSIDFAEARNGWGAAYTSTTADTTASPGHVMHLQSDSIQAGFGSGLVATSLTSPMVRNCGSRTENLPDLDTDLYIFIRAYNPTVPASSTSLTVGFAHVEVVESKKVMVVGGTHGSEAAMLPVRIHAMPTVALSAQGTHASAAGATGAIQLAEARTTQGTAVADGQAVRARADKMGRSIVKLGQTREQVTNVRVALTNTTETTLLAAVASTFNDLSKVSITNTSATATVISFRDTTGGTVRWDLNLAANQSVLFDWGGQMKQTTVNTSWTCQLSVAANVNVTATFEQNI